MASIQNLSIGEELGSSVNDKKTKTKSMPKCKISKFKKNIIKQNINRYALYCVRHFFPLVMLKYNWKLNIKIVSDGKLSD